MKDIEKRVMKVLTPVELTGEFICNDEELMKVIQSLIDEAKREGIGEALKRQDTGLRWDKCNICNKKMTESESHHYYCTKCGCVGPKEDN